MVNEMSLGLGPVRSDFILAVWPRTCYLSFLSPSACHLGTMMSKHLMLLLSKVDTTSESTIAWYEWILLLFTTERECCCRLCGLQLKISSVLRRLLPLSRGNSMTQYLPCVENRVDRSQKDVRCALPDSPALHPPPHRVRVTGASTGHPRVRRMVHNGISYEYDGQPDCALCLTVSWWICKDNLRRRRAILFLFWG